MDYHSTLDYLYSLTDYETERIGHYDSTTLDLSRVERVLARLENPQRRFLAVHIAGTKGKGSVAAICESILRSAGLRTGLFTSPHLHTFRERIQVNGALIPQAALSELVERCSPVFDTEPALTTFEAVTVIAFVYFARSEVDIAVVEVGLGGRLDATNVITPRVSVITSLSLDHTYLLGSTLAEIAREKAGIIKPGVPVVCVSQAPEALSVIREVSDQREAPLTLIGRDWIGRSLPHPSFPPGKKASSLQGQPFELHSASGPHPWEGEYTLPLLGQHQVNNAVLAIAALDRLRSEGVSIQQRHLHAGLRTVQWPGRFEVLRPDPLLVVDCAHNRDSVAKLVATLKEWFPGRRWTFILGVSRDKDLRGMLEVLAPLAERVLTTESRHARAMPAEQIVELAMEVLPQFGAQQAEITATRDVGTALNLALEPSGSQSRRLSPADRRGSGDRAGPSVCATGSIFVVADVREVWALVSGQEPPATDNPLAEGLRLPDNAPVD